MPDAVNKVGQGSVTRWHDGVRRACQWIAIFCMCVTASTVLFAQGITYDTVPQKVLGPELWSVPVGGELTLSSDGTRLLVASVADSAFYLVDAIEGRVIKRLTQPYYMGFNDLASTFYVASNDLRELAVSRRDTVIVWSIDADSLISRHSEAEQAGVLAISALNSRLLHGIGDRLRFIDTRQMSIIREYPEGYNTTAWFDDESRLLYRALPNVIQEIDAATGEILRTFPVDAFLTTVRRPKNSDWLYVFTLNHLQDPPYFVEAINLQTNERVKFTQNVGRSTDAIGVTSKEAYQSGYLQFSKRPQVLWSYNAQTRMSSMIMDPRFEFLGEGARKVFAVDVDQGRYFHTWFGTWKDSAITRCNAMIPNVTGVHQEPSYDTPPWLQVTSTELVITLPDDTAINRTTLSDMSGRLVLEILQPSSTPGPLTIPISHVSPGSYLVVVNTGERMYSSTVTIVR